MNSKRPADVVRLEPVEESRTIADRWTDSLLEGGFVPVVRSFLRNYSALNPPLTSGEAMFVIHLMDFKWGKRAPRPGYVRLAEYMGVSTKMARRYAQSLETKGYLRREYRTAKTNQFDLRPLFRALEAHVQNEKEERPKEAVTN